MVVLLEFLHANKTASTAPPHVQDQKDEFPTTKVTSEIRRQVDEEYDKLSLDLKTEKYPETARYSIGERACDAMAAHIPQVKKLAKIQGGLELAFNLILYLGPKTYMRPPNEGDIETVALHGMHKFDTPADALLLELLRMLRE